MSIQLVNVRNYVRKTLKYGLYIPFTNLLLTYGYAMLPKKFLHSISTQRNRKIQAVLAPLIDRIQQQETPMGEKTPHATIWICWFQGEEQMPEIPRLCLNSLRKHANGHPVVLLTADNYREYVNIPDIVQQKYDNGALKNAHFADILRINLLAQQGGIWVDATLLLTRPLPDEIFNAPFFSIKTLPKGYFVSQCRWAVFCLAAWKGNPLMVKLAKAFEVYLKETDIFVDYFMFDQFIDMLVQRDAAIRSMIDSVPLNNAQVHRLGALLCEPFNEHHWASMCKDTYFFKLSWKSYRQEQLTERSDSYFAFLKRQYGISSHSSI